MNEKWVADLAKAAWECGADFDGIADPMFSWDRLPGDVKLGMVTEVCAVLKELARQGRLREPVEA
ncbi:hypothetical protein [Nocardia jiangxiensis]|uniref:hypothetical protein n=1 Tax=Nocardia jiangxiensis TaxID=282685 RepID=UPI001469D1AC|nr:hypothetical protein [Nocardia jiangxiensis]